MVPIVLGVTKLVRHWHHHKTCDRPAAAKILDSHGFCLSPDPFWTRPGLVMTNSTGVLVPRLLGVVGAGQMGAGIAQVAAMVGLQVTLTDLNQNATDRGKTHIHKALGRLVRKQTLSEEAADAAMQRIHTSHTMQVHLASQHLLRFNLQTFSQAFGTAYTCTQDQFCCIGSGRQ